MMLTPLLNLCSAWQCRRLLRTTPGPSPWYLRGPAAVIQTPEGAWRWHFYHESPLAGLSRLDAPQRGPVLLLDYCCYFCMLGPQHALIWYEQSRTKIAPYANPMLSFLLIDMAALLPVADPQQSAEEMRARKRRVFFQGGTPITFNYCTAVEEGVHTITPPPAFATVPEILALADYCPRTRVDAQHMCRAIFAIHFARGSVTVLPQRWFNEGNYDFGYQWITRVGREKRGPRIFGEGIRLGQFRLDASGTQIDTWFHRNPFFHPEQ